MHGKGKHKASHSSGGAGNIPVGWTDSLNMCLFLNIQISLKVLSNVLINSNTNTLIRIK